MIALVDASPMSSTMSSPDLIHETEIPNPFSKSGPTKARKEDTPTGLIEDDEDVIELETSAAVKKANHQLTIRAPASAPQPFRTQPLTGLLTESGGTHRRLQQSRASSAPPESGNPCEQTFGRRSNYSLRFHQKYLPPPKMPFYMELLSYTQRWGYWVTEIDDHGRRMELVNHVCEKIRQAWGEGMKKALIPMRAPEGQEHMSPEELQVAMEEERGRQLERKKAKRQPSPSKMVVIEIKRNIHTDKANRKTDYSITAGELANAGVKWQQVKERVETQQLDPDGALIARTVADLGRNTISPKDDWVAKGKASRNNPTKRNLMMFCLWEVFRCDIQLPHLKNLLDMAQTDEQRQISQAALDNEQKLRDLVMAVALVLDPESRTVCVSSDEEDDADGISAADSTPRKAKVDTVDHAESDLMRDVITEPSSQHAQSESAVQPEQQREGVVRDVEGYPSRLEIWHIIPPEGLTNQELREAFPVIGAVDTTWYKLVKSVAYKHESGLWLPMKDSPIENSQVQEADPVRGEQSLKITLKVQKSGYNPVDYSWDTINHDRGFKWRYMRTSTIQQRMCMDDVVGAYVESRIDADRPRPRGGLRGPLHRRGTYEAIGHPDFLESAAVVHGIWEVRKNTDTDDPRLMWFYKGGDFQVVDLGFVSYDPVPQGTMEEMLHLIRARKLAAVAREQQQQDNPPSQSTAMDNSSLTGTSRSKNAKGKASKRGGRASGRAGGGRRGSSQMGSKRGQKRKALKDLSDSEDQPTRKR